MLRFRNDSYETRQRQPTDVLTLDDLMPKPQRSYDKNRAPKLLGQPTVAYFHVTGNLYLDNSHYSAIIISNESNRVCKMCCFFYSNIVLSLDSVNEESMTYVTDIFLAQSWRDPRLRLPSDMTEEYRILDVDWLHNIWRPDSFFKNAKKVTFHEMSVPNHYLWLYRDKTLLYMAKYEQHYFRLAHALYHPTILIIHYFAVLIKYVRYFFFMVF